MIRVRVFQEDGTFEDTKCDECTVNKESIDLWIESNEGMGLIKTIRDYAEISISEEDW